jgi:hypothetical protein
MMVQSDERRSTPSSDKRPETTRDSISAIRKVYRTPELQDLGRVEGLTANQTSFYWG